MGDVNGMESVVASTAFGPIVSLNLVPNGKRSINHNQLININDLDI